LLGTLELVDHQVEPPTGEADALARSSLPQVHGVFDQPPLVGIEARVE
jgi:hypothetical protein